MATKPKSIHQTTKNMTKAEREAREQAERKIKDNLASIKPPIWLNTELKKRFRAIAKQMEALELLTILDANHLARYVMFEKRLIELDLAIQEQQSFIMKGRINPLLVEQRQVSSEMAKLETKLGMNPTDRLRFVKSEPGEVDELEAFRDEL